MATQRANTLILFLFTLTIITQTAFSQFCNIDKCTKNSCCSKQGYCGYTYAYCGPGCQNGPCNASAIPPSTIVDGLQNGPRGTIANVVTPAFFQKITSGVAKGCPAKGFYTRQAFITATQSFPAYKGAVTKREIAAILAQFSFDSDSFCYKEEKAKGKYCKASKAYPCKPGKSYYGRGLIQLQWNYNYGAAGKDLRLPLLTDPDMVARNPEVAFKASMWIWNKNVRPVLNQGFGATTKKISNDCYGYGPAAGSARAKLYEEYCKMLGITPGVDLEC